MSIQNIFEQLEKEYGNDLNWYLLSSDNDTFVKELKKELSSDDPFISGNIQAAAKCCSNDDVLFVNSEGIYRIYHLTYSSSNKNGYPKYIEFSSPESVSEYIRKRTE